ncbi:radical SAM protein [Candidatus Woesearchaeota archaeon]|nr:radical SAM protein [Candidatus Woesearchaeota archaeon]
MTKYTILDCYTDEPAGLGVPPYLGTYPRYIAGYLSEEQGSEMTYLTIDDLRLWKKYDGKVPVTKKSQKTDIRVYNLTSNSRSVPDILQTTDVLIVILGVHTPGKYLSAIPGTLKEVLPLISHLHCEKILTGPAVYGTSLYGGRFAEKADLSVFDGVKDYDFSYDEIAGYAIEGSSIISQIPDIRMIEIETSKGCSRKRHCSFCTEPLKHRLEFRKIKDITAEINAFYKLGCRYFRLGKQSCFYSYPDAEKLLKTVRKQCPGITVLHIDNANPVKVIEDKTEADSSITKAVVKYCTPGNIAAFGAESFDPKVYEANHLNATAEQTYEAVRILNRFGAGRGENGMPRFLPGINILLGLAEEDKETLEINYRWLKRMLDENLLLRRINIRQISIFPGTMMYEKVGNRYLRKNRKYYWSWRKKIRTEIDLPMLKNLCPEDTLLKDVRAEIYDGKTTFGRQLGTYPLIVGTRERLELDSSYDVKITGYMLRSLIGEVISKV